MCMYVCVYVTYVYVCMYGQFLAPFVQGVLCGVSVDVTYVYVCMSLKYTCVFTE